MGMTKSFAATLVLLLGTAVSVFSEPTLDLSPSGIVCGVRGELCEACDQFIGWKGDFFSEAESKELENCVKTYKKWGQSQLKRNEDKLKRRLSENKKSSKARDSLIDFREKQIFEAKFILGASPEEIVLYHAFKRLEADERLMNNWDFYECKKVVAEKYRSVNLRDSNATEKFMQELEACNCLHTDPEARQSSLSNIQCQDQRQDAQPLHDQPSKIID